MSAVDQAGTFVFRTSVVLALATLAGFVLWCTPLPKLYHASCQRPCHELDWPMICRVKITLEMKNIMGSGCGDCSDNRTDCFGKHCLTVDGSRRRVLTANGQLPGPSIHVCENDILVVDVINRVPGSAATIHWRGQPQRETPYMDGVAMVTQCPAPSFTTFQYKFRASQAGTHLWQVHAGNEQLDNLFGALIVRQSTAREPHRAMYDVDDPNHVILISEWQADSDKNQVSPLLINGRAHIEATSDMLPYSVFNISANKRHRLRIASTGGIRGCPVSVRIQSHPLLIIAIDGHPIIPTEVKSFKIAPGERVDIILTANQEIGDYWLRASTGEGCTKPAEGSALFRYIHDTTLQPPIKKLSDSPPENLSHLKVLSTVAEGLCSYTQGRDHLCLPKIQSLTKIPDDLATEKTDFRLYLPFDFVKPTGEGFYREGSLVPRVNNFTFMFPPSPLLSQGREIETELLCSSNDKPSHCDNNATVCECVHIINIPLQAAVELILIDQGGHSNTEHIFHLHGHSFYVVGTTQEFGALGVDKIREMDKNGQLLNRNLKNPIIKDTVSVPPQGLVALRFKADNPGYWLLHDQSVSHWANGLDVLLHVGESSDVPPVPDNFPRCGSWVGPEFFLI